MPFAAYRSAVILHWVSAVLAASAQRSVQCAAQLVELLFPQLRTQAAQGQAGNVICAVGGNFLAVNGAGALSFSTAFTLLAVSPVASLQLKRCCRRYTGPAGVDAGRDINAAIAAHAGRGGHGMPVTPSSRPTARARLMNFCFMLWGLTILQFVSAGTTPANGNVKTLYRV